MIKKIVILGGGSAGWLTAGLIAAECQAVEVVLVESPEVSTIGVGEGTWPTMRNTLNKIGISETEFIRDCSASFKQGSKFIGWTTGRGDDVYHHPFTLPSSGTECNLVAAWRNYCPNVPFSEAVSFQSRISDLGLAPKNIAMAEYAGALNYGYHLDADRLGVLLSDHCQRKLGVTVIRDHVTQVNSAENGDVESLMTKNSGIVQGDLFIDCSGGRSLLIGQHYGIKLIDQSKYSVNDRVLAARVPYGSERPDIASMTMATAMSAGWIWDIGLSTRRGVGYVYSSAYIDDEAAENELREYLKKGASHSNVDEIELRQLRIAAGYREKMWVNNCVAIGMSAGFIEPLEASALALVELSAKMITNEMPMTRKTMEIAAQRFNRTFRYRWEKVVEFLKLHYVLSSRSDTQYWIDARSPESIPDGLNDLLELWRYRAPSSYDFQSVEEVFPSASYQYVLYGMGFRANETFGKKSDRVEVGIEAIKRNFELVGKFSERLPKNFDLIEKIRVHGLQKI